MTYACAWLICSVPHIFDNAGPIAAGCALFCVALILAAVRVRRT